jgi:phage tail tape-measure protein
MTTFVRASVFGACAFAALQFMALPAQAVGCLSGAAAGAVAGHVAGGHAVVGAAGGCIVGHELAVRKNREAEANKLIAEYETSPEGSPQRSKDLAGISRLARKDVPVAVKWMQEHNVNSK